MKNFKGFAMGLVLGLGLAVSGIAFAQNDQKKEAESCCAMASCCGQGDSCSMKDHKDQSANHAGCCCCGGDSCDMKAHDTKEKPKN
ncbi:MAG TPA: hypothetical protein VLL54_18405 [Pyrinomonadaceae bacterium]|nr:hypothetical protein [Pyrinomonadaceae bacterium]